MANTHYVFALVSEHAEVAFTALVEKKESMQPWPIARQAQRRAELLQDRLGYPILPHFRVQGGPSDAEAFRCLFLVPGTLLQDHLQSSSFAFLENGRAMAMWQRRPNDHSGRKVRYFYPRALCQDDGVFDTVFQFPNVSRP